jgi:PAS domain S-box-containing protein
MNPAAERLTGSSFEAARGRQVRDVLRLVDDSARRVMGTPLEQALESGQPIELREARILGVPEGEPRLISDSAAPVRDRDETLGAVMVFRDVTEQRQSEKQLEVADRLTSLSSMAAGVAREINNPLTVITTNAEYVLGEVHDFRGVFETGLPENGSAELLERADAVLDALREAQAAAGRIIRLVSDLHTFSRVPRAEVALCDVGRIIHTAVRETQQQCRGRARLTMHIENVPPVRANEHRLAQVIVRLLLNAVHTAGAEASDSHDVQITLRVEQRGRVVIEVRDNGPGFSADLRDRIFEPFSVENVTDTGLSLAICHGIIQSFGGQIEVDSQVGKGTLFRILLPRAGSLAPSAATESATAELRALGGKRKILVIDDEQLVLRAVRRVLGQHYEVVITDAARQAVQLVLDGQRFDLILCDLMMPDMSGMEFYEWLVSIRPEEASRVVFLTGGAVSARADEFLRGVSNPRVEKPFDVTRLKELVRLLLPS